MGLASEDVDYRQDPQLAAVAELVVYEVGCPSLSGPRRLNSLASLYDHLASLRQLGTQLQRCNFSSV